MSSRSHRKHLNVRRDSVWPWDEVMRERYVKLSFNIRLYLNFVRLAQTTQTVFYTDVWLTSHSVVLVISLDATLQTPNHPSIRLTSRKDRLRVCIKVPSTLRLDKPNSENVELQLEYF